MNSRRLMAVPSRWRKRKRRDRSFSLADGPTV
jgi:hypothetical protein